MSEMFLPTERWMGGFISFFFFLFFSFVCFPIEQFNEKLKDRTDNP